MLIWYYGLEPRSRNDETDQHASRMAWKLQGAVAVIFDEDLDSRYSYMTTWLGEHQNESDMAFYATQPFEHLVGPDIGRPQLHPGPSRGLRRRQAPPRTVFRSIAAQLGRKLI